MKLSKVFIDLFVVVVQLPVIESTLAEQIDFVVQTKLPSILTSLLKFCRLEP